VPEKEEVSVQDALKSAGDEYASLIALSPAAEKQVCLGHSQNPQGKGVETRG
jgi:hypothetical protein